MDTFRKEYKTLSDEQKDKINAIKDRAVLVLDAMNEAVPAEERSERSRSMAVARTNLEQAIMWAVKSVSYTE